MARPRKLNEGIIDKLCEAIEVGATYDAAAAYAGIAPDTLSKWRTEGEALFARVNQETNTVALAPDELMLWRFYTQFTAAQGRGIVNLAITVQNGAMKDYRFALEVLARRCRDEWGAVQRQEVTGAAGGPVVSEVVRIYVPDNGREPHGD